MPAIHTLPLFNRPREKLVSKGAQNLSDYELFAALIGNGNRFNSVDSIALRLQQIFRSGLSEITYDRLLSIPGIHHANACRILAALEITTRHTNTDRPKIYTVTDALPHLEHIRTKLQEYLVCLSLDGAHRLIAQRTITVGTLQNLLAHPREVFADAIADRAACVIIAHNHPSNDPQPSEHDLRLTGQLVAAGHLLGIPLYDHLIVSRHDAYSFKQHHIM